MKIISPHGIILLLTALALSGQAPTGSPAPPVDPQVVSAINDISPQRIQQTIEKLVSFQTRHTLSSDVPASSGKGINAAAEWIKGELEGYSKECGGCLEVTTDEFTQEPANRVPKPTKLTNIYAILHGSDSANSSRIVLVSGHYDARNSETNDATGASPGANDDGSGTAVSIECARVLSKHKFPATIIFLIVAGEEQGLYGSAHFAKMARAQGWNIEAILNNDIVGGDKSAGQDPHTVRVFSEGIPFPLTVAKSAAPTGPTGSSTDTAVRELRGQGRESDSSSRELARYIASIDTTYLVKSGFRSLLVFRPDRYLRGGDQTSFNEQGFAAVRFTEYRENYNHQHQNVRTENGVEYGDLPKFVDYSYVANVARLNAATLASIASAPAPPAQVRLLTKSLVNDSTLAWDPSPGGLATGYVVLWRDTGAPQWEHSQTFGNVTQATLPLSKDNVFFAVQASDSKGHGSLPVIPVPER